MSITAKKPRLPWSRYIPKFDEHGKPYRPTKKQAAFLLLPHLEAMYGGSAGGGKSECLLIAALQYVDVPGYSAVIFRRAITDSNLSGAIYNRAQEWLAPFVATGEVKHVPGDHKFIFPSGAELTFAYLRTEQDHERYKSAEFQFIGFDELTTFDKYQYLFMFSRLRKIKGSKVPLRVRSGTNPGGIGLVWVRNRFRIVKKNGKWIGTHPHRKFIQAFVSDNPHVDASYQFSLHQLDPVTRSQMKEGDWSCNTDALYKEEWFVDRYTVRGSYFSALASGKTWHRNTTDIFFTIDPAASQRSMPQGINFFKNKEACWSVVVVWALTQDGYLMPMDMIRKQCNIPELLHRLIDAARVYRPTRIICERNGLGSGVSQVATYIGLPVDEVWTAVDKIKNAAAGLFRAEKGRVILPEDAPWLDDFENEVFTWMGSPNETDDIVDNLSNACKYAQDRSYGEEVEYLPETQEIPVSNGCWSNGRGFLPSY